MAVQERERQRELELIKQQYLGAEKQKKKVGRCEARLALGPLCACIPEPRGAPPPPAATLRLRPPAISAPAQILKATERMKFVFDWDAAEDTSRDLNPLYQNLHGRSGAPWPWLALHCLRRHSSRVRSTRGLTASPTSVPCLCLHGQVVGGRHR